jgi:hypothetical protein
VGNGSRGSQFMCGTKGGGKPIGLAGALPRKRTLSGNVDTLEAHRCGLTSFGQIGRGYPQKHKPVPAKRTSWPTSCHATRRSACPKRRTSTTPTNYCHQRGRTKHRPPVACRCRPSRTKSAKLRGTTPSSQAEWWLSFRARRNPKSHGSGHSVDSTPPVTICSSVPEGNCTL